MHNKKTIILLLTTIVIVTTILAIYLTRFHEKKQDTPEIYKFNFSETATSSPLQVATSTFTIQRASTTPLTLENLNNTPTAVLARDLFTKFAENRAQIELSNMTPEAFAEQYLQLIQLPHLKARTYTAQDIALIPTTTETIKNYESTLVTYTNRHWPQTDATLAIIGDAVAKDDMALLERLIPLHDQYAELLKTLLEIPVPTELAVFHVDSINGVSLYLAHLQNFINATKDPVSTLSGLDTLVISQQIMRFNLYTLREHLDGLLRINPSML